MRITIKDIARFVGREDNSYVQQFLHQTVDEYLLSDAKDKQYMFWLLDRVFWGERMTHYVEANRCDYNDPETIQNAIEHWPEREAQHWVPTLIEAGIIPAPEQAPEAEEYLPLTPLELAEVWADETRRAAEVYERETGGWRGPQLDPVGDVHYFEKALRAQKHWVHYIPDSQKPIIWNLHQAGDYSRHTAWEIDYPFWKRFLNEAKTNLDMDRLREQWPERERSHWLPLVIAAGVRPESDRKWVLEKDEDEVQAPAPVETELQLLKRPIRLRDYLLIDIPERARKHLSLLPEKEKAMDLLSWAEEADLDEWYELPLKLDPKFYYIEELYSGDPKEHLDSYIEYWEAHEDNHWRPLIEEAWQQEEKAEEPVREPESSPIVGGVIVASRINACGLKGSQIASQAIAEHHLEPELAQKISLLQEKPQAEDESLEKDLAIFVEQLAEGNELLSSECKAEVLGLYARIQQVKE